MGDEDKGVVKSYRDLIAWQKGMDLVELVYELTDRLPSRENFGLKSQMQRAATSIPANISEGNGRRHTGDYIHHLSFANGSLKELETYLILCVRLKYMSRKEAATAWKLATEVGRLLARLIQSLQKKNRR